MANKKLTDLTELTTPADNDFLYIVDVSDTTESAQGTSKKIRKDKVDSGASKENIANKSDIYTTDTEKYYSATYVNGVLPTSYSKIVYVNATSPTTATIFDLNNPPAANDNLLKNDTANLYIGTDASTWVYLTGTGYVTKTISSATSNFNTFGTTVDAGNSKTSHITRSGPVTLTGSLNLAVAKISTTPNTSAGSYDILTRNSSTTALEKKLVSDFVQVTGDQSVVGRKYLVSNNTTEGGIQIDNSRTSSRPEAIRIYNNGTTGVLIESTVGDGSVVKSLGVGTGITIQNFSTGTGLTLRNQGGTGDLLSAELGKVTISSAGKLSTTEVATSGNNVTNKTYVDAKITQTITNGVTDKSPSEDAIFDALENVTRNIINTTSTATVNGTLTETLLYTGTILANSIIAEGMAKLNIFFSKGTGGVGNMTLRVKVNSVNDFATSQSIGVYTTTAVGQNSINFIRNFTFSGNKLIVTNPTVSIVSDEISSSSGFFERDFITSNVNYIFISIQLTDTTTDIGRLRSIKLTN